MHAADETHGFLYLGCADRRGVERRDTGLDDGIDRLVRALSEHGGGDPELLCDELRRAVAPGGNDDDIALLVLRVDEERLGRSA